MESRSSVFGVAHHSKRKNFAFIPVFDEIENTPLYQQVEPKLQLD